MFRFAPYVLKTLWRHRTRTLLTVSGAAVAFFVYALVTAVNDGFQSVGSDAQANRRLIVFQANRFCPFTSQMPEDYARTIAALPEIQDSVRDVLPIMVYTNNCRASLDVVVFHGVPAEGLATGRDMKLLVGDWADFTGRQDAALVGHALAVRRGLQVGKPFTIGGVTVQVVGIFSTAIPAEEDFVYTHLKFLQRMRGRQNVGKVTQFEIQLTEGADVQRVAAAIDARFADGPVATDTRPKGVFQASSVSDMLPMIAFARYLGFACVGVVLSLVATTAIMGVQDRVREHAVLQTIGVSAARLFRLVLAQSVIVSVLGGGVGIGLGEALLAWGGLSLSAEGVTIPFTPSIAPAAWGLLTALAVGVLAGVVPAWQAARSEIVVALRQA